MIKKIILCLVFFAFISFTLTNNFSELVTEKLDAYVNEYPEKVYVQTDKPYYTLGEDIWYTAYLVNGITHKKSNKSSIVYVELINEQDSILLKKQLYTTDISVAGDFKIKKEWRSGNYLLRAYTQYMRNKDTDYFFQKEIPIWDAKNKDSITQTTTNLKEKHSTDEQSFENPEIHFYPESGYLVDGLNSNIGIKVKDKNNRNIIVEGVIKDSDHNTITWFKTYEFGLGLTSLTPSANQSYYVSVFINNKEVKYPLPKSLPSGYHLSILNRGNELILKASSNLKNSFLVAHQRGQLVYKKLETESKHSYVIKINTENMQDGVTHFTLFNSDGKPVCERLVYIDNPKNKVSVNINYNNISPKIRDKMTIQIDLKDVNENALTGNLSMSVTDLEAIAQSPKHENIKTYLLLNSDLRGHIPDPGYFFQKENDVKRLFLLDLVMLTHGWRRFTWNALLYGKTEQVNTFEPEKGLSLSGYTTTLQGARQQIPTATRLTIMKGLPFQQNKQTDANGRFKYGPFVFYDSVPVLIEARVKDFKSDKIKNNRQVSIHLNQNSHTSPKITRNQVLKPNLEDEIMITNYVKQSEYILNLNSSFLNSVNVLDEILITANKKTKEEEREEELNERTDYGFPTHRLDLNDLSPAASSQSVLNLLRNLPGVLVYGSDNITIRGGTPRFLLDGIPVELQDISYLMGSDIEFIDVLLGASASMYSNGGNGIIAIHTKQGNGHLKNVKRQPGIINFVADGFYTAREFYAPDYSKDFNDTTIQDIRSTLHWEPKIELNSSKNKAEVSFFTSDTRSKYAIKIEGITHTGIPIYHVSSFEVD